ncbi:MAG: hypothetical protein WBD55_06500 [Dehalococcoidia bacterium]
MPELTTLTPPLRTFVDEAAARRSLREQIAKLERELGTLFASAYPRRGIGWKVDSPGGPRLLGMAELEELRDRLAGRVEDVRADLRARNSVERSNARLIDRMLAAPAEYKWVQVSAEDVGVRGCKHWHSLPKLGIIGMMLGWWRVKISSGCP